GLLDSQYEVATALGLMKSAVSFALIYLAFWIARRFANYIIL
ncbi:MAG TPA: sugar ABC transporter permease, partial [Clostridia bacterium]|nr:sugar ABC transporter permease [Clostridia bacterium]